MIKDPRAIEPLIAALKDTSGRVGQSAAVGLAMIGTPAVEPLIAALKDPNPVVRRYAAGALGVLEVPRAVDTLLAGWREDDLLLIAGASAFFIRRGEPGSEDTLIRALKAHGSIGMAETYLNCGNSALEAAADEWARAHGFRVLQMRGGTDVRWRTRRQNGESRRSRVSAQALRPSGRLARTSSSGGR
jgi:hypothetical protein